MALKRAARAAALAAIAATAVAGLLCFSAPFQPKQQSSPRKGSADAVPSGENTQQFGSWALGVAEIGFGTYLVLLGSGLLRQRVGRAGGANTVARRAAAADDATGAISRPATAAGEAAGFDLSAQYGVCEPFGEPGVSYWDPAGLADGMDSAMYRQYRGAEIKHGRISMLAIVGLLMQRAQRFHFVNDGPLDLSSAPSGLGAVTPDSSAAPYFGLLFLMAGFVELTSSDAGREPGDFGDPWGFSESYGVSSKDEEAMWRNFEINNGRLAMFGIIGTLVSEYVTGLDAVEQWKAVGSAFARTRAFASGDVVPSLSSFM